MSQHSCRQATFYLLVILIPLTIFLISGELLARLLAPPQVLPDPPPISTIDPYQPNPYIVKMRPYLYSHIPGSTYIQARSNYQVKYEINAMGFRGSEISRQKPAGIKRLLVIGDSIVEGHGSEFTETFSHLLGKNLRSSGWEVVNGGVQGASPIYFAANIDRYLSLRPDAVLIVIFEKDIFEDRVRETEYFALPFLDDADRLLMQPTAVSILSGSRFYTTLRREWQKLVGSPVEQIIAQNQENLAVSYEQWALLQSSPNLVEPSFIDQQWNMSQSYLDYAVTSFHEHDVRVFVTNLSLRAIQPNSSYYAYAHDLDQRISSWTTERQIPFLSLLPVIAQAFEKKPLSEIIIEGDRHPTPKTHAMIEATLRPWLLPHLNSVE